MAEKIITWSGIALVFLVPLIFALGGWAWTDTRTCIDKNKVAIETLKDTKVDKSQYQDDVREIKEDIKYLIRLNVKNGGRK